MDVAEPGNYLEFLDFKRKWGKGKITEDVHSKPCNSFTYVLPNIPSQEKYKQHST